jgi:hypothetical protein
MNLTVCKPREVKKPNIPVMKSIQVPINQRGKLLGLNGINLKRIYSKTGKKCSL